jgi:hypothetical protein
VTLFIFQNNADQDLGGLQLENAAYTPPPESDCLDTSSSPLSIVLAESPYIITPPAQLTPHGSMLFFMQRI